MKGKKYIPFLPNKPKQGPKITRLFSWKKHKAEKAEQPTEEKPKSRGWRVFKTIAFSFAAVAIVFGAVLYFGIENSIKDRECDPGDTACILIKSANDAQKNNGDTDPYYGDTVNNKGSGYCSTNSDCSGFGARNGGPAICGSDRLCHICLNLRGETCISGSTGCGGDPNIYIEQGVCVFKLGGRTTD